MIRSLQFVGVNIHYHLLLLTFGFRFFLLLQVISIIILLLFQIFYLTYPLLILILHVCLLGLLKVVDEQFGILHLVVPFEYLRCDLLFSFLILFVTEVNCDFGLVLSLVFKTLFFKLWFISRLLIIITFEVLCFISLLIRLITFFLNHFVIFIEIQMHTSLLFSISFF